MKILKVILGLMVVLVGLAEGRAAESIGTNALLTYTDELDYRSIVHWRPGDGAAVNLNPPRFTWLWDLNRSFSTTYSYRYIFQCSYSSDLSAPVVNVETPYNYYNAVDHFTNSPVYWRVGYIESASPTITNWATTRSFTIATNATIWDRAAYFSAVTLSNLSTRPRICFNPTNLPDMREFLRNPDSYIYQHPTIGLSNYVMTTIANDGAWTNFETLKTHNGDRDWTQITAWKASLVGLVCQMESTNFMDFSTAGRNLEWAVTNYTQQGENWKADPWGDPQMGLMGIAYDWLYYALTTGQRNNILTGLDKIAAWQYTNMITFEGRTFSGDLIPAAGKVASSHVIGGLVQDLKLVMAIHDESAWGSNLLAALTHYFIGQASATDDEHGMDRGSYFCFAFGVDGYGYADWSAYLTQFYGASWTNHPGIRGLADFARHYSLVSQRLNGDDPWGDGGGGYPGTSGSLSSVDAGNFLKAGHLFSRLTYSPEVQMHHLNEMTAKGIYAPLMAPAGNYAGSDAAIFKYFPTNSTPALSAKKYVAYPYSGWVMGCSTNPSSADSFSNAVGFKVSFRPNDADNNHTFPGDGHIKLWCKGALVTSGGAAYMGNGGSFLHRGFARNTVLVDGQDMTIDPLTTASPNKAHYAQLTAYQEGSNYLYCAGSVVSNFINAPWVTKANHHILFMRDKYLVQFLNYESISNSTFASSFWVQEPTLTNLSATGFTFSSSNLFEGRSAVTTRVEQIGTGINVLRWSKGENWTNAANNNVVYNNVSTNPFTGVGYHNGNVAGAGKDFFRSDVLYYTNTVPSTNFHLLTVIYPVYGDEPVPTITRIDDYTVAITNGSEGDVISFDVSNQVASLVVDTGATNATALVRTTQPILIPAGPTVELLPTNIAITSEPGAVIFWRTNSGEAYQLYSLPVLVNHNSTLWAYATNTDRLDSYVTSQTFVTNNPVLPTVGTPVFNPPGASFATSTSFTLSCPTDGAVILYSIDGSVPSITYLPAVTVTNTLTARAKAVLEGYNDSAEATATFTKTNSGPGESVTPVRINRVNAQRLIIGR